MLIGLNGRKQAGKDTVCSTVVAATGSLRRLRPRSGTCCSRWPAPPP